MMPRRRCQTRQRQGANIPGTEHSLLRSFLPQSLDGIAERAERVCFARFVSVAIPLFIVQWDGESLQGSSHTRRYTCMAAGGHMEGPGDRFPTFRSPQRRGNARVFGRLSAGSGPTTRYEAASGCRFFRLVGSLVLGNCLTLPFLLPCRWCGAWLS